MLADMVTSVNLHTRMLKSEVLTGIQSTSLNFVKLSGKRVVVRMEKDAVLYTLKRNPALLLKTLQFVVHLIRNIILVF